MGRLSLSSQAILVLVAAALPLSTEGGLQTVDWTGTRTLQASSWHPSRYKQQATVSAASMTDEQLIGEETSAVATNHGLDSRPDLRECLTYRKAPAENTWEHVEDKSIYKGRVTPIDCKHRKFQDFPKLAYSIYSDSPLVDEDVMSTLKGLPHLKSSEVHLWLEGPPGDLKGEAKQAAALWKTLSQENHFMIYSTSALGEVRAFNRMVKFAQNAELVVLVRDHDLRSVTTHWLSRVQTAFDAHPALAMVGGSVGNIGGGQKGHEAHGAVAVTTQRGFELVDEVHGGPLVIRRDHFLALGQFALPKCRTDCAPHFEVEFSARAWLAGYEVAVLPTDSVAAIPRQRCDDHGLDEPRWSYTEDQHHRVAANVQDSITAVKPIPKMLNCVGLISPNPPSTPSNCEAYPDDTPKAALMVQYFRRPANIKAVAAGLKIAPESTEILINNDSGGDHVAWRGALTTENSFLFYSHDIHEIRAYNRLGLFANSEMLITLQDDDVPTDKRWIDWSLEIFHTHPRLIYMTGYRARTGTGGPGNYGLGKSKMPTKTAGQPFAFAYKLVAGPLHMRRSTWLELGMFNMNFSCAGDPGIHFEYEYSLRTWFRDYQAGIYDCKFSHHVGNWKSSGTRANKKVSGRRAEIGNRNSRNVKFMYRNLHGNADAPLMRKAGLVQQLFQKGKLYKN